jgi:HTH-type transcriptional regulator/antitoxin HigA
MNIKPIKTKADHANALKEIQKLFDAEPDTPESDRLDILVTLVEAYEKIHHPIDPPDPVEAIKFRMDQQGLKSRDLAQLMGGKNRVSEVLARKRPLSLKMIKNLHKNLRIPYESLLSAT